MKSLQDKKLNDYSSIKTNGFTEHYVLTYEDVKEAVVKRE